MNTRCFKLHRSYSVSFNLSNVGDIFWSVVNPKGPYLSLEIEKAPFCVLYSYSKKRAHEIRKFHVAVVQPGWLKNVQKSVMHVQSCCFANKPVALFAVLFTVAVVVAQAPYCCDPEILLPW